MIIYRENVGKFISQCLDGTSALDIGSIISKQMRLNGITYFGDSQVNAWNASLPEMALVLKRSNVDENIDVAVEYKLVQSRDRIDFLICGNDEADHENVVVIELKQWSQVRPTNKQYFVNTFGGGGEGDFHRAGNRAVRVGRSARARPRREAGGRAEGHEARPLHRAVQHGRAREDVRRGQGGGAARVQARPGRTLGGGEGTLPFRQDSGCGRTCRRVREAVSRGPSGREHRRCAVRGRGESVLFVGSSPEGQTEGRELCKGA